MVGQTPNQAFAAVQRLAGRYAGRVARLWPAPYDGYRGLSAARRHVAHITMARVGSAPGLDAAAFRREIADLKMRDFLARWTPGMPRGLESVLAKCGEQAWAPGEYRQLLGFMKQGGEALKTLRHAKQVTPAGLEALAAMPERLRGPAVMRWIESAWDARLVAEALALARHLSGGDARFGVLVERLGRAKSRERFFTMLVDELRPNGLAAPVTETEVLRPLRTVAEVREAGRRFRNCLGDCVHRAVFGSSAFVEWRGPEPAVMELEHEGAAGWRLVTLLAAQNRDPTPATARAVRAALAEQGVRSGFGAEFLLSEIEEIVTVEHGDPALDAPAGDAGAQPAANDRGAEPALFPRLPVAIPETA